MFGTWEHLWIAKCTAQRDVMSGYSSSVRILGFAEQADIWGNFLQMDSNWYSILFVEYIPWEDHGDQEPWSC